MSGAKWDYRTADFNYENISSTSDRNQSIGFRGFSCRSFDGRSRSERLLQRAAGAGYYVLWACMQVKSMHLARPAHRENMNSTGLKLERYLLMRRANSEYVCMYV